MCIRNCNINLNTFRPYCLEMSLPNLITRELATIIKWLFRRNSYDVINTKTYNYLKKQY